MDKENKRKTFYDFSINKRIREYLEEKGKETSNKQAVKDFAEAVNVSEESVRQWRNGYTRPDLDKIVLISNILNCSLEYLFGASVCKNIENININKELNLIDSAINSIKELNKYNFKDTELLGKVPRSGLPVTDILNNFLSKKDFWITCKQQADTILSYYNDTEYKKQFDNISKIGEAITPFTVANIVINQSFNKIFNTYIYEQIKKKYPNLEIKDL